MRRTGKSFTDRRAQDYEYKSTITGRFTHKVDGGAPMPGMITDLLKRTESAGKTVKYAEAYSASADVLRDLRMLEDEANWCLQSLLTSLQVNT